MNVVRICSVAAFLACVPCVTVSCSEGSSTEASAETGKLDLALRATSGDVTYQLTNATFIVSGASDATLRGDDAPEEALLTEELLTGQYQISLQPGWQLVRQIAGGTSVILSNVTLQSPAQQSFAIANGETTRVSYQFLVDGQIVNLEQGTLEVGIQVTDNSCNHPISPEVCGDAVDNDCDGTVDEGCTPQPTQLCAEERTGDTPCPAGYQLATFAEATANVDAICNMLGLWDIVRLGDGGSIDGPGYGCGVRAIDTREVGNVLCSRPTGFVNSPGDGVCAAPSILASVEVARAFQSDACGALGAWSITRLAGGGSMDGSGYGCGIRSVDSRELGDSLCANFEFVEGSGDSRCAPGQRLITADEARAHQSEFCALLGAWDIVRLAGGGSIDGSGYGCTIRDSDTRELGQTLCTRACE